jgi:hypothetical protein
MNFLKGYKTYVLAIITVGYGVYLHFFGDKLPWEDVVGFIFGGTGMATLRAAIGGMLPD